MGGMDIYQFQMPEQFEVAPTTFVEGFVKDSITKKPLQVTIKTNIRGSIQTDENGRFFICMPAKQDLTTKIQHSDYFPFQVSTFIPQWDNQSLYPIEILLSPKLSPLPIKNTKPLIPKDTVVKKIEPIVLVIYFDFDDFGLNPHATKQLDKLFSTFQSKSFEKVEIIGYADIIGNSDYNLDLSKKRSANVAKYLSLNDINSQELIILGKGEHNEFEQRHLNRRVIIKFQ